MSKVAIYISKYNDEREFGLYENHRGLIGCKENEDDDVSSYIKTIDEDCEIETFVVRNFSTDGVTSSNVSEKYVNDFFKRIKGILNSNLEEKQVYFFLHFGEINTQNDHQEIQEKFKQASLGTDFEGWILYSISRSNNHPELLFPNSHEINVPITNKDFNTMLKQLEGEKKIYERDLELQKKFPTPAEIAFGIYCNIDCDEEIVIPADVIGQLREEKYEKHLLQEFSLDFYNITNKKDIVEFVSKKYTQAFNFLEEQNSNKRCEHE